jgi:hypothetical protein
LESGGNKKERKTTANLEKGCFGGGERNIQQNMK